VTTSWACAPKSAFAKPACYPETSGWDPDYLVKELFAAYLIQWLQRHDVQEHFPGI
jgi:hypothetical protein